MERLYSHKMGSICHFCCAFYLPQSNVTDDFLAAGIVLVYCRPPRSVLSQIRCRVRDIRDQVHLGWIRDERVSWVLDVRDKKPDSGGLDFLFALGCVS